MNIVATLSELCLLMLFCFQVVIKDGEQLILDFANFEPRSIYAASLQVNGRQDLLDKWNGVTLRPDETDESARIGTQCLEQKASEETSTEALNESTINDYDDGYRGVQRIGFHELVHPNGEFQKYRVRDINEKNVHALVKELARGDVHTLLMVLKRGSKYVVIDGNHRFHAMEIVRNTIQHAYDFVDCSVYEELTTEEALGLGYRANRCATNVLKMTDYQKVDLIIRVTKEKDLDKQEELDAVYKTLGIDVKDVGC